MQRMRPQARCCATCERRGCMVVRHNSTLLLQAHLCTNVHAETIDLSNTVCGQRLRIQLYNQPVQWGNQNTGYVESQSTDAMGVSCSLRCWTRRWMPAWPSCLRRGAGGTCTWALRRTLWPSSTPSSHHRSDELRCAHASTYFLLAAEWHACGAATSCGRRTTCTTTEEQQSCHQCADGLATCQARCSCPHCEAAAAVKQFIRHIETTVCLGCFCVSCRRESCV